VQSANAPQHAVCAIAIQKTCEMDEMTSVPVPIDRRAALSGMAALLAAGPAAAASCGPDRLGTARVLAVGTAGGLRVGLKTYPQTLALAEGEVILTFDDGPGGTTSRVLDILACEGVRATFFMIGRNATASPGLVRRVRAQGHTLACHSLSHPWTMRDLAPDQAIRQAQAGFQAIVEAAGEGEGAVAPFFRYPGFADTAAVNAWLADRQIGVFGCDLWASDWTLITPEHQLALTLSRLEAQRRGIILFHDTQARTAAMLPAFLRALATRGYRVVHMVAGSAPAALTKAPAGWTSETERIIAATRGGRG
jgi:peptidoglycan/xylan/chitin deacetylase (PgdA/CDA1 family)